MSEHHDEQAARRGHVLSVHKHDDWTEDEPYWDGDLTCLAPDGCGGWWGCDGMHEVAGQSAEQGPYDCDDSDPWCGRDEFTFHGVEHTWRGFGIGWTVPYEGCVVATADYSDDVYEIGQDHGEGHWIVDDEWGDPGDCTLIWVRAATAEELPTDVRIRPDMPHTTATDDGATT